MTWNTYQAVVQGGNSLAHYGTAGMHWGVRRYQNPDGTLTELGKKRYGEDGKRSAVGRNLDMNKLDTEVSGATGRANRYRAYAKDRMSKIRYKNQIKGTDNPEVDKKVEKWNKKADDYEALAKRSEEMKKKIIQNTLDKKLSVIEKTIARSDGGSGFIAGNLYRVKKDGKGKLIRYKRDKNRVVRDAERAQRMYNFALGYYLGS